ncbi:hypothetical protein [Parabacteroides chongii]|uniref:hypothetical protein n=1 Tax=Parabacteroides chongii TaxID=2685834 RepID=UPI00240DC586|nr:hypothetical protein [Parabacteroides chongii]WFE85000.1 hypothetical protein P3L47_23255 [Parabacteroides chongii]WFE85063.1 hypothetical protein P3L47_00175 [Parabacteroides chongii]
MATSLNWTKQGDKYVSDAFDMASDSAGLQVVTNNKADVLVEISIDGTIWRTAAFNYRGVKAVVDVISGGKAGLKIRIVTTEEPSSIQILQ